MLFTWLLGELADLACDVTTSAFSLPLLLDAIPMKGGLAKVPDAFVLCSPFLQLS